MSEPTVRKAVIIPVVLVVNIGDEKDAEIAVQEMLTSNMEQYVDKGILVDWAYAQYLEGHRPERYIRSTEVLDAEHYEEGEVFST